MMFPWITLSFKAGERNCSSSAPRFFQIKQMRNLRSPSWTCYHTGSLGPGPIRSRNQAESATFKVGRNATRRLIISCTSQSADRTDIARFDVGFIINFTAPFKDLDHPARRSSLFSQRHCLRLGIIQTPRTVLGKPMSGTKTSLAPISCNQWKDESQDMEVLEVFEKRCKGF